MRRFKGKAILNQNRRDPNLLRIIRREGTNNPEKRHNIRVKMVA